MKHFPIQLFDNQNDCLLPAEKAKQLLKTNGIRSIQLLNKDDIYVPVKDLQKIKKIIKHSLFMLDQSGTELDISDIQKIMKDENIPCE
jgi:hypothetical protein